MTPELIAALTEWMPRQRWFAGKGTAPALSHVGSYHLTPPHGVTGVTIVTALLLDEGGRQPTLYQVPLTLRDAVAADSGTGLAAPVGAPIATLESGTRVYDGAADLYFAHALLALITGDAATAGAGDAVTATGRSQLPGHPLVVESARVLSGEQSNTSIIMTVTAPGTALEPGASSTGGTATAPVICKVFRVLHEGNNPDVVLQSALAAAGSTRVPASIGSVVGHWPATDQPDGHATGHLAFAQEFLPGVRDAWRVALDAVDDGRLFTAEARALGEATAEVHETLAAVMPTVPPSADLIAEVLASMRGRHASAVHEVPELAGHDAAIERLFDAAARGSWPALQRIHGDYHLGQVLAVPPTSTPGSSADTVAPGAPSRTTPSHTTPSHNATGSTTSAGTVGGWVLVDFEGEPLRPMSERSQPDLALRDVAGMLRSFDYVAGSFAHSHPGQSADAWAVDARRAFLDGYVARSGLDLETARPLLDAFEIDKALYEAVYEARNRPSWLPIPVAAIARLAAARP